MISSMLLVWVIAATTAAGCYLLRPWNLEWSNGVQRFVFAAALGLGAWLLTLFWCGWLVSFTPAAAAGVTAFFSVPLALYIAKNLRSINCLKLFFDLGGDVTAWVWIGVCVLVIGMNFAASFAPVAGMADALTYQLNLPKEWIREGQIRAIAFDINCAFPMLVNTGYGFGLLFGCPAFANGLALWISILCAAAVYGWSLEKAAPRYAWLAAAVFLLTPAVYNHVIAPYVDLTLALCCACAFWAFDRWARTESCPWLGLSGIFCGLALGAKYLALIYFLILAAAIVVCALRQKQGWSGTFRAILLFGFFAAVTSFVWYVRSSWIMGNPLYPYLFKLIGGRPSPVEWQLAERAYGVGYNLWNLAAIFWDATFQPQAYAGFGTRWNLIFLGLLPLVVWLVVRRQGGWLAFLSGAMLVSWFYLSQVMRFLMAFFPLYCVLIGWAAQKMNDYPKCLRRTIEWWVIGVCMWELACAANHVRPQLLAAASPKYREEFLLKREPSYGVARWVNEHLSSTSVLLSVGELRHFYFKPRMVREDGLRLCSRYPEKMPSPEAVIAYWKAIGLTHVLVASRPGETYNVPSDGASAAQGREARQLVKNPAWFRLLHGEQYRSPKSGGEKNDYQLYEIL